MKTTSLAKLNLRQQSWANYLSQFKDAITVTYKASSLITVPDTLSRLKARLKTGTDETTLDETLSTEESEATNVFTLTFVELEEGLSQSISDRISLDPRMGRIRQTLRDSA